MIVNPHYPFGSVEMVACFHVYFPLRCNMPVSYSVGTVNLDWLTRRFGELHSLAP